MARKWKNTASHFPVSNFPVINFLFGTRDRVPPPAQPTSESQPGGKDRKVDDRKMGNLHQRFPAINFPAINFLFRVHETSTAASLAAIGRI